MTTKPKPRQIDIDLVQVEALAARGLTFEQIADNLGVNVRTLFNRRKQHSEFSDAIKRGKAKGIKAVSNALFESATGGNVTAMIFWLKAQALWVETSKVESNITETSDVTIKTPSMQEFEDKAKELLDKV